MAPWRDPRASVIGLNDAYNLGFPRADEWYELHPLDKMVFRDPKNPKVLESAVPPGSFVRPAGHLDFLKGAAQRIPVWLQETPPADWPANACRFPIEAIEEKYGQYWASGPAYELMHLYERGYREIHIYGIHLSTEHEYREQRPNFEFLIGRLLGPEVRQSVEGDLRYYRGRDMTIVFPKQSPILTHQWKYAYEAKPSSTPSEADRELRSVRKEREALLRELVKWPVDVSRDEAVTRLARLDLIEQDILEQAHKAAVAESLTITIEPIGAAHA